SEFYSVAPDRELSSIVKQEIEKTIQESPAISKYFKLVKSEIRCELKKSKMIALATSNNRMDGRKANVYVADEVGALRDSYPIQAMQSSQMNMVNRTGILISTAYQSTDNPMTQEVEYAEMLLDVIIKKVKDKFDYLVKLRNTAIEMPGTRSNFLTKHMNIFVDGDVSEAYMNIDDLQPNKIDYFDWRGKEVYVGVDLSLTTDNTAV